MERPSPNPPAVGDQPRHRDRYRAVFDGLLDPVIVIDDRGIVLEVSRSFRDVFGYAPDELIGRNVKLLMAEPHRSEHDAHLERYRRTGKTWILGTTREFDVLHRDGRAIPCELSVSRVEEEGREGPIFVGSFRDISRRKIAEEALRASEERFRAIFDQEVQLVGLLDPDGTILEMNRSALDLIGVRREDVIGLPFCRSPWWQYVPGMEERVLDAVRRAGAGEFVRFEVESETDRGPRSFDVSLKPVLGEDGNVAFLLPEARDITFLKRIQRRETAMLRSLAAIGENASALAHEIKNPLTAVNMALRAVADGLGEDQRAVVEELAGRLRKLEKTMRRTLSFAKPPDIRPEEVDLGTFFARIQREFRPELEAAGVEAIAEVGQGAECAYFDKELFEEVFTNLIRNSIQARTEEGGRLVLRAIPSAGGWIELQVEDDGPGIPRHLLPDLFQPFVSGRAEGFGIGLALVRKIVEAHDGTVEVDTGELGGARFRIRLPRRSP
ncbi:MAG TPA: PAS domain-containing sensor histidine kinase [Planctomycetes bacterium]|nr:PAS domain-containing sensor histidine kinase [Planctomycetota bacterium]